MIIISNPVVFVGIIPARYASSRFPGKPLADIGGKSMIQRVYEQASKVLSLVYVATDDQRIFDAVKAFGGKVIMTSTEHKTGTDRCYEASTKIKENFDVVINIQGDEPFIQPEQIVTLQNCFQDNTTEIATLAKLVTIQDDFEYLANSNRPKVVINKNNEALYFSRSIIPYIRGKNNSEWIESHKFYTHIGMYAYRKDVLQKIHSLPPSPLETAESLEQLRWLENGFRIKVGFTDKASFSIDTPEDLKEAQKLLKSLKNS